MCKNKGKHRCIGGVSFISCYWRHSHYTRGETTCKERWEQREKKHGEQPFSDAFLFCSLNNKKKKNKENNFFIL